MFIITFSFYEKVAQPFTGPRRPNLLSMWPASQIEFHTPDLDQCFSFPTHFLSNETLLLGRQNLCYNTVFVLNEKSPYWIFICAI